MWSWSLRKGCLDSRVLLAVLLAVLSARDAAAADWSLKALFSETTLYNDNRKLEPISPGDTWGALSSLSLDLGLKTRAFHLDLTSRLYYPYYFGAGATLPSDNKFDASFSGSAGYERKIGTNNFHLAGSVTPDRHSDHRTHRQRFDHPQRHALDVQC